jgi:uncharacterized protein (UPF0254 family)
MAEERYTEWKASVTSWELRHALIGLLEPGRYRGFDTIISNGTPGTGVIPLKVTNTATGLQKTQDDNTLTTNLFAMLLTRQGVIIHTDTNPELDIDDNIGNVSIRYDYLIAEYEWVKAIGGQAMSVSILKGPLANPTLPTLTNPEKTVILGTFELAPAAAVVGDITYTPAAVPSLGNRSIIDNYPILDITYARLAQPNIFTKMQSLAIGPSLTIDVNGKIIIPDTGNYFIISTDSSALNQLASIYDVPIGTTIYLEIGCGNITLVSSSYMILGNGDIGIGLNTGDVLQIQVTNKALSGHNTCQIMPIAKSDRRRLNALEAEDVSLDARITPFETAWLIENYTTAKLHASGGGSVTLVAECNSYKVIGKTLIWNYYFILTVIGNVVLLDIELPGGLTHISSAFTPSNTWGRIYDSGATPQESSGMAKPSTFSGAIDKTIQFQRLDGAAWTIGSSTVNFGGQIIIPLL